MSNDLKQVLEYMLANIWYAAVIAVVLYGSLFTFLKKTDHVNLSRTSDCDGRCKDHREKSKYGIFGGVGTFSIGTTPLIVYFFFPHPWLLFLAMVQFWMSAGDILVLYLQFAREPGNEVVNLYSHGMSLRAPGCARTSVWDPIGLFLFLAQNIFGFDWLAYVRGVIQFFLYDLTGTVIAFVVMYPARLLGKKVIPHPI